MGSEILDSMPRAWRKLCFALWLVMIAGCTGGGGSTSPEAPINGTQDVTAPEVPSKTFGVSGSAVKGPLVGAHITVYQLDTTNPSLFDQSLPLASTVTTLDAKFGDIRVPADKVPYVLVVDGRGATDLDTNQAPLIPTLIAVVTEDQLVNGQNAMATPLTTIAFYMAKNMVGANGSKTDFLAALDRACLQIRSTLAYAVAPDIDPFRSPVLPDSTTLTDADVGALLKHRALIEYVSALVVKSAQGKNISADAVMVALAKDLSADGVIDDSAGNIPLNVIDLSGFRSDPGTVAIPNTAYLVKDTQKLLEDERKRIAATTAPLIFGELAVGMPMMNSDLDGDGILNIVDASHFDDASVTVANLIAKGRAGQAATHTGPMGGFHNHVHNFSVNLWDKTAVNYAMAPKHSVAMGYSMVTVGVPQESQYKGLGVIKLHNAYYAPMRFDFGTNKVYYFDYYALGDKSSAIHRQRKTYRWEAWNSFDMGLLTTYGCARVPVTQSLPVDASLADLQAGYYTDWTRGQQTNIVMNFQSKTVVDALVQYTLDSVAAGNYQALFFDDIARDIPGCANREVGGSGAYPSWKDGQKDYMKRVVGALRLRTNTANPAFMIFGNIWSPKSTLVKGTVLKWYADASLRLDHYYYEAGAYMGQTIDANGVDPENGLPAYTSVDGYLPANRVSVSTPYGWYTPEVIGNSSIYREGRAEFFQIMLAALGVSASQGSWFGWYGGANADNRDSANQLVYTNDLQLMRAIPNWDNLVGVPLAARNFDVASGVYSSPNSYVSRDVVYSRHYERGELFAVFRSSLGEISIGVGQSVVSAEFADTVFNGTGQNAMSCIVNDGKALRLLCQDKVGVGIKIKVRSQVH